MTAFINQEQPVCNLTAAMEPENINEICISSTSMHFFFLFITRPVCFFQRQGKKLSFTAHTWTTELTLSSLWRKIAWQNLRQYPKSFLWKKGFDTVWLFFHAQALFQFQKTLYFVFILFLLCVLVNKCPDFGTGFSLCHGNWVVLILKTLSLVWCCSVMWISVTAWA